MNWPEWSGAAVCIANGPSLTRDQVEWARQFKTIAINHVIDWAPWADIWYAADRKFWVRHSKPIDGIRVSADIEPFKEGLVDLRLDVKGEPSEEQYQTGKSSHGQHSGFQALVMAITLGAKRVYLLGYDCKASGKINAIEKEPELCITSPYARWAEQYGKLRLPVGVSVINATPGSAITAFPMEIQC